MALRSIDNFRCRTWPISRLSI